jgi:ADP-dependent NAD(P)H-hydrate dehydratase / NAD(P)H-hydrate epimerase
LTPWQSSPYHRGVQPVISSQEMRDIDRLTIEQCGIASLELMENAASATARFVIACFLGDHANKSALIFCGKGNNGGDGAAVARLLATAGAAVDVVLIGKVEETRGDARTNFDRLQTWKKERDERESKDAATPAAGKVNFFECDSEGGWEQLHATVLNAPHQVLVDALFGTGLTRPVEGLHREVVRYLGRLHESRNFASPQSPIIVSIDIPSGLNADSEQLIGEAVQADATVTMTAPKRANVLSPAAAYNGKLIIADIGSPFDLIKERTADLFVTEALDAQRWLKLTRYTSESYKNKHGHALIVAGSRGFTGAAALCGNAAMRAGAGLVTVATPVSAQPLVATQVMPEVMTAALAETDRGAVSDEAIDYTLKFAERADVIAIGPGLSAEDDRTRAFVRAIVENRKTPVVIDADGLNCMAPWPADLSGSDEFPIVLTPHPGEMRRLVGSVNKSALDDRVATAREFATNHKLILVLKGSGAIIAAPDGRVVVNLTGNAGLATAGAGDTLTGVITGFLAQAFATRKVGPCALRTVIAAVYVSGLAGDLAAQKLGMRAMVASDIREHLSEAICSLDPIGEVPPEFIS